jgi:hypothetical protein
MSANDLDLDPHDPAPAGPAAVVPELPASCQLPPVRNVDADLLRLHEIEARMAFARFYFDDQRAAVERLRQLGQHAGFAHALLRTMEDSLSILEQRRLDLLQAMEAGRAPGTGDGEQPRQRRA